MKLGFGLGVTLLWPILGLVWGPQSLPTARATTNLPWDKADSLLERGEEKAESVQLPLGCVT